MTRARVVGIVTVLLALLVSATRVVYWQPFQVVDEADSNLVHADHRSAVSGVIHVHTSHSDGGGDIEDVAMAAKAVGLNFVIVTDHNTFAAKPMEGYVHDVLIVVGTEVSTRSGHVLGFGIPVPTFQLGGEVEDVVGDIEELGGAMFAAHPTSPRADFRWTAWDLKGRWGIEIVNGDTQWRLVSLGRAVWATLLYPLNPTYSLLKVASRPTGFEQWDKLLAHRDVAAIAGSDSHNYIGLADARGIPFPSYRSIFRLVRNHVVLPGRHGVSNKTDPGEIMSALGRGRSYIGLDGLAPAGGFFFVAEAGEEVWTMGDTVSPSPLLRLHAGGEMPSGASVSLIRDGQHVTTAKREMVWSHVSPGVYRVEVSLPDFDMPWIISNPIYVFDSPTAIRRQSYSEVVPEKLSTRVVRSIDDLGENTSFVVAGDESSIVREDNVDMTGGPNRGAAARLEFVLGLPSDEHPSPFAALTSFGTRDLSGGEGLTFSVKGDGVYRLTLQVRDSNPRSANNDGTEWWGTSVKTSREWRHVIAPFNEFRTNDSGTDGELNSNEVEGLVFVVDKGTVPPGTAGSIWFNDLALYSTR